MNSIPKQAILLIIFSIISMFCQDQLAHGLRFLLHIHNEIESLWKEIKDAPREEDTHLPARDPISLSFYVSC